MADNIGNEASNVGRNIEGGAENLGREVAGSAREAAGNVEQGLGNAIGNAGMAQQGQSLEQSGADERAGVTAGATGAAPSSATPAHESLADAVEGLRTDAGTQGRTLEQAEEQGVLEAGYDNAEVSPGFFGDHEQIDDTGDNGQPV